MNRAITATEANQRFSEMLRLVANGESFTVMSRGRPVARVLPVDRQHKGSKVDRLLESLSNLPIRRAGAWTRDDLYE